MIINERVGNGFGDFDIPGDNKIPEDAESIKKPWQTVGTTNNSWGYKSYDEDWKSVKELLFWLVEIVSKGGNYMLNIGPTATGTVPKQSADNLLEVGNWLALNGEAIYGTDKWRVNHEGPTNMVMGGTNERQKHGFDIAFTSQDFWFTAKENTVYIIALESPDSNKIRINSFVEQDNIKTIEIISGEICEFRFEDESLIVFLPEGFNEETYVLKVNMD